MAKKASQRTVRARTEQSQQEPAQPRRLRRTAGTIKRPLGAARQFGAKEYYLPLPNNRFGRFLNKRRHVIPRYFRDSWSELRQTTWPNRKETRQLTVAVFLFALVFGLVISVTDYGLDKLFRKVLLK